MTIEQLIHYFEQQVAKDTLSHAYLFSGNDYSGKKQLTQAILQTLVCQQPIHHQQPCQQCELCKRVATEQFADKMVIQPEGQIVKVDQIRQLKEWLGQTPIEATFKFAVIEKADTMNASAANALLTFLEEPVANVYLILYVSDVDAVLPTIRSRAQHIYVNTQPAQRYFDDLEAAGIKVHHARMMSYFDSESIEQWREQYDAVAFEQWYKHLHLFYRKLLQGDSSSFVTVQTHLKASLTVQHASDGLTYYLAITHQLLKAMQLQQEHALPTSYLQELVNECQPTVSRLLVMYRVFFEAKKLLKANVSPQMSYEYLAIELGDWH